MRPLLIVIAVSVLAVISTVSLTLANNSPNSSDPTVITVMPHTINLNASGEWVTVNTNIPLSLVNASTVALNGIPVSWVKADARGQLVAKFTIEQIRSVLSPPATVLTLTGYLKDGTPFGGQDTVEVIDR